MPRGVTAIFVGVRVDRPIGRLHLAPIVADHTVDQCKVATLHLTSGQLVHQRSISVGASGHGQEARRALVEPVHDARSVRRAHPRCDQVRQVRKGRQEAAHEGAFRMTRTRVYDQTGRLVDHGQALVGVHDREADVGFGRRTRHTTRRQLDCQDRSLSECQTPRHHGHPIDLDTAGLHQLGGDGPRDAGKHRDAAVDPDPGQGGRDLHGEVSSLIASPALVAGFDGRLGAAEQQGDDHDDHPDRDAARRRS